LKLIANSINNEYLSNVIEGIDRSQLERIDAAVAYVTEIDGIEKLARQTGVPFALYALGDGEFPHQRVTQAFVSRNAPLNWQLLLTRDYFHAKVLWFRGVGAYIGSANLSQKAWFQSIECGVWISEDELANQGVDDELRGFFSGLADGGRFVQATERGTTPLRFCAN
jgi:phosphatidylserine/phosphatidylglycerophosphate/cardiolipin synthase-like enzyme